MNNEMFLAWTSNSKYETSLGHSHSFAKLQLTTIWLPFISSLCVQSGEIKHFYQVTKQSIERSNQPQQTPQLAALTHLHSGMCDRSLPLDPRLQQLTD